MLSFYINLFWIYDIYLKSLLIFSPNRASWKTIITTDHTVGKRKNRRKFQAFRDSIKADAEKYAAHKEKDAERSRRNRRRPKTPEEKARNNEMARLRMAKSRLVIIKFNNRTSEQFITLMIWFIVSNKCSF